MIYSSEANESQTLLPALSRQSEMTVWTKLPGSGTTLPDLSDRWITTMMPIGARLPNGSVKPLAKSSWQCATLLLAQADNRPCTEPMLIAPRKSAAVIAAILVQLTGTLERKVSCRSTVLRHNISCTLPMVYLRIVILSGLSVSRSSTVLDRALRHASAARCA